MARRAYAYSITLAQAGPVHDPDFQAAGPRVRADVLGWILAYGLKEKDADLAAGLDKDGVALAPVSALTRKHRRSAMGPADPDAPALMPAYAVSRTRLLLTGDVSRDRVIFTWEYDPHTAGPWGKILDYQRKGVGKRKVKRDVIGISHAALERVRGQVLARWTAWKLAGLAGPAPAKTQPAAVPVPRIRVVGRTDVEQFTYGIGGSGSESTRKALAAGYSTGFFSRKPGQGLTAFGGPYRRPEPPPGGGGPAPRPAPPPPPPAPLHPVPEIDAAYREQRRQNALAAAAAPVVSQPVPTSKVHFLRSAVAEETAKLADLRAEMAAAAARYPVLTAERDKAMAKADDYTLTKATRVKWEKRLAEIDKEFYPLHRFQAFGPEKEKRQVKFLDDLKVEHAEAMAEPAANRAYDYAAAVKAFPDLIPPGPVAERLAKYTAGDAKVKAIVDAAEAHTRELKELVSRRAEIYAETDRLVREQCAVVERHNEHAPGTELPPDVVAELESLGRRIDLLAGERFTLTRRIAEAEGGAKGDVRAAVDRILTVRDPATFRHTDVAAGFKTKAGPLFPVRGKTADTVAEAEAWLSRVTARGDGPELTIAMGDAPHYRAHCAFDGSYIQIATSETADVVVHEYGHAIEATMQTAGVKPVERGYEFLHYRVGDETPVDMHAKFGAGDPGEMGRKDHFTGAYPEEGEAYYVGKDYGVKGTEILAMGIQKLFNDPAGFAKNDPEYCKYVLGILDGSLR